MKIGILTFHWANNYGAVIQAYALLSKLKELGHEAYIIDRQIKYKGILRRLYHRYSYNHRYAWLSFDKERKHILSPMSASYKSHEELVKGFPNEKFDAVIVGSDQVWRWNMMGNNYFLDFLKGTSTHRYAYAASFGLSEWKGTEEQRKEISALLKEFNAISVRENSGVKICHETFGVDAQLVLDPTLLHERSFYENTLLKDKPLKKSGKVVSYMLGANNKKQVLEIAKWAKNKGLKHNELFWTSLDFPSLIGKSEFHFSHVDLTTWLDEIRNAEYVITNSFHATVFCILFGKKFVVLENTSGGTDRIYTLLNTLNLSNRFQKSLEQEIFDNSFIDECVKLLEQKRTDSLNFILKNIIEIR